MSTEDDFYVTAAQRDDLPAILQLYRHLHASDTAAPSVAALYRVWDEILDNPGMYLLVGKRHEEVLASCTLIIIPNLTRGARPYGLIENVVTHTEHRGKGFATLVLRIAKRIAWDRGCYKVMLMSGSKQESTMRFYERAGFARGVKTGFIATPDSHGTA